MVAFIVIELNAKQVAAIPGGDTQASFVSLRAKGQDQALPYRHRPMKADPLVSGKEGNRPANTPF